MSDDLRKQRSESSEGKGLARRAWDRYAEAANSVRPGWVDDAVKRLAGRWTADLMGFWMSWHLHGGFEGLERAGWHRATIYRKLKRFRTVFKVHPDAYKVVGVTLDHQAFWDHYLKGRPENQE
ncbi:MAG TPA: hypothetical protein VJP78_11105 [Thermoleophilia bacterium]|nr:hypothetical protein [Thermoleophilia bacterium]